MTNAKSTPPEAALVAIDVSKTRFDVLIEAAPGARLRRLVVLNSRAEHDRLIAQLRALNRPIIFGFDATGNYHRVLAHRLDEAGFEARPVSTMVLELFAKAIGQPREPTLAYMIPPGCTAPTVAGTLMKRSPNDYTFSLRAHQFVGVIPQN